MSVILTLWLGWTYFVVIGILILIFPGWVMLLAKLLFLWGWFVWLFVCSGWELPNCREGGEGSLFSLFLEHFIAYIYLPVVPFQMKTIVEDIPKHLFLFSFYIWLSCNLCFLIFFLPERLYIEIQKQKKILAFLLGILSKMRLKHNWIIKISAQPQGLQNAF